MTRRNIWNLVAFNLGWFACVLAAANGEPMLGPAVMLVLMVVHCATSDQPGREAGFLLTAGALGTVLDSLLLGFGILSFDGGFWIPGLSPLWMTALWVGFGSLFSRSLAWIRERWVLGMGLGAIGGPLAYLGGARLEALTLHPDRLKVVCAVAVVYAIATPTLILLCRRTTAWSPIGGLDGA